MKIKYMSCPRCGAALQGASMNNINYCSFCGAPLFVDDGVKRTEKTTIIRDEARIREAENASRRLDLEMERLNRREQRALERSHRAGRAAIFILGSTLKTVICIIGILFIALFGLIYLISPIDILSGIILDDFGIIALCWYLCSSISDCMHRY